MFDSSIGATTVAMPLGGKYQQTLMEGSVQTLPIIGAKDIETVSLASWGFDAEISKQNSLLGSFLRCCRKCGENRCNGWRL
jgi:phosphoribosylformylglycinamidine synthase